jgi:hypothetical protein
MHALLLRYLCFTNSCVVDALLTDLKDFSFWLTDLKEFSTRPVPVQQALLGLLNLVANKPQVFFLL